MKQPEALTTDIEACEQAPPLDTNYPQETSNTGSSRLNDTYPLRASPEDSYKSSVKPGI